MNKNNLTIILIGIIFLSMISLVTSASTPLSNLGTFKTNSDVKLRQTCDNSSAICSYCTISSVTYPNSSEIISLVNMTNKNGEFNYSLSSGQTGVTGPYNVNGFCSDGYNQQTFAYYFTITPTGDDSNTWVLITLVISSVVLLILGLIFVNPIFVAISGFSFMGTGVYGLIFGFADINNSFTQIIGYIAIGLGLYLTYDSIFEGLVPGNNDED